MSNWLAGLALNLAKDDDERLAGLGSASVHVLAGMALFVSNKKFPKGTVPECYASQASIAQAVRMSDRTVRNVLGLLAANGAIERCDKRGKTIRWRLIILSEPGSDKSGATAATAPLSESGSDKSSVRQASRRTDEPTHSANNPEPGSDKNPEPGSDNPSESSGALAEDDSDDSLSSSSASLRTSNRSDLRLAVEHLVARTGWSKDRAEKYVQVIEDRRSEPIQSWPKYIDKCLDTGSGLGNSTATTKPADRKRRTGSSTATKTKPADHKRRAGNSTAATKTADHKRPAGSSTAPQRRSRRPVGAFKVTDLTKGGA